MSKVKVSILVPIYNSSEYLRKCLDSLKKQTLKEVEFILINDGSTDNSLQIMREYEKEDFRFKILNKKNSGYGDSLNKGIHEATGKYIGIVEPDDYCDKRMFEVLYELAKNENVPLARGGYYYHSEAGNKKRKPIFSEKELVYEPLKNSKVFCDSPAIWSAIYEKKFLEKNGICFLTTPGASYQDTSFFFKTMACAKRVAFINRPLYYYKVDNPDSSVKKVKNSMMVVGEYREIERFINKANNENRELLMKYCQVAKFGSYNWNLIRLSGGDRIRFIKIMKKEFLQEKRAGRLDKRYFPKKYWLSLKMLLTSPSWFYYVIFDLKESFKVL